MSLFEQFQCPRACINFDGEGNEMEDERTSEEHDTDVYEQEISDDEAKNEERH